MSIETIKPRLEAYLQFYCTLADGPDERNKAFRYVPFELACSRLLLVDQVIVPVLHRQWLLQCSSPLGCSFHETNGGGVSNFGVDHGLQFIGSFRVNGGLGEPAASMSIH
jgi:hypothetical protein